MTSERKEPKLIGGVHRDVTGRADEPLRFFLSVDRGLKSGTLDSVELTEDDLLALIVEGAQALRMLRGDRRA
jgi:hypothetical protein